MTVLSPVAPPERAASIADFPDEFDVDVTDEDILLGVRRAPGHCALARATIRTLALSGMPMADVLTYMYVDDVRFAGACEWRAYRHNGARFVVGFDAREQVKPTRVHFRRSV